MVVGNWDSYSSFRVDKFVMVVNNWGSKQLVY